MISDKELQIRGSLANAEYRESLAIEHVNTILAIQIRKLRECRQWSQQDLAEGLGKHQETISQWEDPDYGRYTTKTLQSIAKAFGVVLMQKYISYDELVKDMLNLSEVRLCPPNYEQVVMKWDGQELLASIAPPNAPVAQILPQTVNVDASIDTSGMTAQSTSLLAVGFGDILPDRQGRNEVKYVPMAA